MDSAQHGYNRQAYALTLNQKLSKHLDLSVKATFSRRQSDNMPVAGYDESSAMYGLLWGYNVNPMRAYRDEYFQGRYTRENYDLGAMSSTDPYNVQSSLVYNSLGGHNPYRVLYEELNTLVRNRVYGNVALTAHLLPGLDLTLRGGMDMNNDFRTQQKPKMTADYLNGMYREQTVREYEFNIDFLLKYQRAFLNDRLTLSAAVGRQRDALQLCHDQDHGSRAGDRRRIQTQKLGRDPRHRREPPGKRRAQHLRICQPRLGRHLFPRHHLPHGLVLDAAPDQMELHLSVGQRQRPARQGAQNQHPVCEHAESPRFVGQRR